MRTRLCMLVLSNLNYLSNIERPHILKYYRSISFKFANTISISDTDYCDQEILNWLELILFKYSRLLNLNPEKKRRCKVYTNLFYRSFMTT